MGLLLKTVCVYVRAIFLHLFLSPDGTGDSLEVSGAKLPNYEVRMEASFQYTPAPLPPPLPPRNSYLLPSPLAPATYNLYSLDLEPTLPKGNATTQEHKRGTP